MPNTPVIKTKNIFKLFIRECRSVGIKLNQYPFITEDMGKRSVERYCAKLHLENLIAASKRDGEKYSRYMSSTGKGSKNTIITRPYQRVQFDAHVIDLVMTITANTVEGLEVTKTINRINLLTIIDEATRVILGYHLSYNQNYSSTDVLHCIRNAITPRISERTYTIPGLKYSESGGYPSSKFPECKWAVWDELLFDNAKANLSQIVKGKLQEFVGSFTNAGPVSMPERRGLIERFFGLLEENGFQRLPNTTGSNSKDPKRQNPEKNAIKHKISEHHLEELLDVLIAEYNATPHGGLNYLSPLETLEQRIQKGELIRTMDENMKEDFAILTIQASRTVRGKFKSGVSPHINYEGVVYRSDVLVKSPDLIGTKLDLLVNTEDLRAIKAFLPDGSEFGLLQATGKWFYTKHSLRTRKIINSLKSRKLLHFTNTDDPILIYYNFLEDEVSKGKKASGNKLMELRREITEEIPGYLSSKFIDEEREHNELKNSDKIYKKEQYNKSRPKPKPFNKTISY